ncbi:putative oxidoreductase YdhV [subsurface metagenome]
MSNFGYVNKVAHIDLTTEIIRFETPGDSFYRTHLGGRGLALYYLLKDLDPNLDPYNENNILIFSVGVTTGAKFPGNSRFTAASKSPLTNGYGESECGGFWGAELKFSRYSFLIPTHQPQFGQSFKPILSFN